MKRLFGLIGFPLGHSFSKKYFTAKFEKENITDCRYETFELPDITSLPSLIARNPDLRGLNVTIPHKEAVLPFLNELDQSAESVGAVNVIKVTDNNKLIGYNSDYYGFKSSLETWLPSDVRGYKALVLGTGGAAKAVAAALQELNIPYQYVSRQNNGQIISYNDLSADTINDHLLIINTTPLGMAPKTETCPPLDYEAITENHFLYDLVYNPEETLFMKKGNEKGAKTKNGLEMLHLQAEKSWEIWNKN